MFNPPFILVLSHDEVQISKGIPSLHPIVNLFCHQQLKITSELELIQNDNTHFTFNQQYAITCSKPLILTPIRFIVSFQL
jgi:hypothetical protein